jgi:hypothetical protein
LPFPADVISQDPAAEANPGFPAFEWDEEQALPAKHDKM